MVDLVIRNGQVVTPSGLIRGGVAVEGEQIVAVGADATLPQARRTLDAHDQYVIPGIIDCHVHMGSEEDPSIEEGFRANLPVETEGAVHGGVTTFGHFVGGPAEPLVPKIVTSIREGNRWSRVDFFFHAFVMGEDHLKEQPDVYGLGVTSFKHFFNAYKPRRTEDAGVVGWIGGPVDSGTLYRSLRFIAEQGPPAIGIVHCEEIELIEVLEDELRQAGRQDLAAWTEARPNLAEVMRIRTAIDIARLAKAPLHIAHMSTGEGADVVAAARAAGFRVTAETGPSWLTHTADMEGQIGCWGKVNPPLRYREDNERLWRGLREGSVSCLGTDHGTGGRTRPLKERGGKFNNIWNGRLGIRGGLQHLLPVMMTYGVDAGRMTIEDLVRVGATNTAKLFGLYPRKGVLAPGADADIVVVDPEREAVVSSDFYKCRCEVSIYEGVTFRGLPRHTILRGEVVMEEFTTTGKPGQGHYLPRGPAAKRKLELERA